MILETEDLSPNYLSIIGNILLKYWGEKYTENAWNLSELEVGGPGLPIAHLPSSANASADSLSTKDKIATVELLRDFMLRVQLFFALFVHAIMENWIV